jgi:glycyl-tRNA synthetase beta chain
MWSDVLFELGTEELPSFAVKALGEALFTHVTQSLLRRGLIDELPSATCLATPRRLALLLKARQQEPVQHTERQGPSYHLGTNAEGEPSQALLGFARSCGVSLDALSVKETEKGKWWVYQHTVDGLSLKQLIPGLIQEAISALPVQKMMRWGIGVHAFARPVHWAILMLDDQVIEASFLGCKTDRLTYGHRFHHPEAVEIAHADQYIERLEHAHVVVDFEARRRLVKEQIVHAAASVQGIPAMDDDLVDEVTSIVEWPVGFCVPFDQDFLQNVPSEALIAAMRVHQKCFPVYINEQLMPYFITVSNINSKKPNSVIQGNERVMRARLSDAAFFYAQDKQLSLVQAIEKTKGVIFQEKLGTLYDKSVRIAALVKFFEKPFQLEPSAAVRAATLCKADLMSSMVSEFPELEGLMGYYYSLNAGESLTVANALKEQYWPRFSGDILPQTALGRALSLADRLDTLVGAFAVGVRPTSTKDPFKLRRHAVAVLRLLKEEPTLKPVSLFESLTQAALGYPALDISQEVLTELHRFVLERIPAVFQHIEPKLIQAVLARQDDCFYDFEQRLLALAKFFEKDASQALSAAAKRVERLLKASNFDSVELLVNKSYLVLEIEQQLLDRIELLEIKVQDTLSLEVMPNVESYDAVLTLLADSRDMIDDFFDQVLVMVEDENLKLNRLTLLARLCNLFQSVGDISRL